LALTNLDVDVTNFDKTNSSAFI